MLCPRKDIKDGYAVDPLYGPAQAKQRDRHSLTLKAHGCWTKADVVAVPANADIRKVILRELHCSPYAGHFGVQRTQELITRYYWWPHMQEEIEEFVKGCVPCQRGKPMHGAIAGKLLPLPVPAAQ